MALDIYKSTCIDYSSFQFSRTIAHLCITFCDADKCNKSKNDPSDCYLQRHFLGSKTLAPVFPNWNQAHLSRKKT